MIPANAARREKDEPAPEDLQDLRPFFYLAEKMGA